MTQADVDGIVAAKLNTVRLPLPFWIIEDIVDRTHEPYAQGGLDELIRGLNMFNKAGLNVILDHHALPGVAASGQMFAGNCTTLVEFYSSASTPLIPDYNYKRAVTWGIVMAFLSHAHPAFEKVFTIEGVNEPIQNAALTPGLGRCTSIIFIMRCSCICNPADDCVNEQSKFPTCSVSVPSSSSWASLATPPLRSPPPKFSLMTLRCLRSSLPSP